MRVTASADAAKFIRAPGRQLFVRPAKHRPARLTLAFLNASADPPAQALDFRRVEAKGFLHFIDPALQTLPEQPLVVLRGRRHPHIEADWDGLAYIAP